MEANNIPLMQRLTEPSPKAQFCKRMSSYNDEKTEESPRNSVTFKPRRLESKKRKHPKPKEIEVKMEVEAGRTSSLSSNSEEQDGDNIPQLFIDVHLDDQSIHRLTIYEGDDPRKLAKDF
jgi:hypothetical protein